jgi:hypothetical protein
MARAILEQRLAEAEQRVTVSELCVARMRKVIGENERRGGDSTEAQEMLDSFLECQAALLNHCARLWKGLKSSQLTP